jgi:hypothetical protein
MEKNIDLTKVQVTFSENTESEIQLTPKISIKMKYPEFSVVKDSLKYEDISQVTFNMIAQSIEYIYDGEQFYYGHEAQPGEMLEFVEGMNQEQFSKVEKFLENLPKLKEDVNITCSKCGYNHTIEVEGLESFFG